VTKDGVGRPACGAMEGPVAGRNVGYASDLRGAKFRRSGKRRERRMGRRPVM
jgi:hypothetical protein